MIRDPSKLSCATLLAPWISNVPAVRLSGLTTQSKAVTPGMLFCALQGHKEQGSQFITEALSRGASAVLIEACHPTGLPELSSLQYSNRTIPLIYLPQLRQRLSAIAGAYYGHPSRSLRVVGITGTNGKTTISELIRQWLNLIHPPAASIGTLGIISKTCTPTANTTPCPILIQQTLANLIQEKVQYVAMEVSSHALDQSRVSAINFAATAFTNITHEHLDYHHTMDAYAATKKRLFDEFPTAQRILNGDDPYGVSWLSHYPDSIVVSTNEKIKLSVSHPFMRLQTLNRDVSGYLLGFNSSWGRGTISTQLVGAHNISNVLIAFSLLLSLNLPLKELVATANQLVNASGRMEQFSAPNKASIFVDYAHTPDALEKALKAVRTHCQGKLICIFGCGGARDKKKRPVMGCIAEQHADQVILTDDNPREEVAQTIFEDILSGIKKTEKVTCIHDRNEAILKGFQWSGPDDILLIAGKGHEAEQWIGTTCYPQSDREMAMKLLRDEYDSGYSI